MRTGALVLGYHGCDRTVGKRLVGGETDFRPSSNNHDWLGSGIYFWEQNPRRAQDWAKFIRDSGHA